MYLRQSVAHGALEIQFEYVSRLMEALGDGLASFAKEQGAQVLCDRGRHPGRAVEKLMQVAGGGMRVEVLEVTPDCDWRRAELTPDLPLAVDAVVIYRKGAQRFRKAIRLAEGRSAAQIAERLDELCAEARAAFAAVAAPVPGAVDPDCNRQGWWRLPFKSPDDALEQERAIVRAC